MIDTKIIYDENSHVFKTYMRNGTYNPYIDLVIYDGGEITLDDDEEENNGN